MTAPPSLDRGLGTALAVAKTPKVAAAESESRIVQGEPNGEGLAGGRLEPRTHCGSYAYVAG